MQGILNSFCERVKSQVSHQKINVLQQQNRKLLCRGTLPSKKKKKALMKAAPFSGPASCKKTRSAAPGAQDSLREPENEQPEPCSYTAHQGTQDQLRTETASERRENGAAVAAQRRQWENLRCPLRAPAHTAAQPQSAPDTRPLAAQSFPQGQYSLSAHERLSCFGLVFS